MDLKKLRTFVSIPVPNQIYKIQNRLVLENPNSSNLRLIDKNNIHLTLRFIGQTPQSSISKIKEGLDLIVNNFQPFQLNIQGFGFFPNMDVPKVLWAGLSGETDILSKLVISINDRLKPLGFDNPDKEYTPHISLARSNNKETISNISQIMKIDYDPIPFNVKKINFISSELFPKGSVYTILSTHFIS